MIASLRYVAALTPALSLASGASGAACFDVVVASPDADFHVAITDDVVVTTGTSGSGLRTRRQCSRPGRSIELPPPTRTDDSLGSSSGSSADWARPSTAEQRWCGCVGTPPGSFAGAVFLKSLNLKGFKSFADSTTMVLEPGVTVVVGPNGSGKSNVVDAIAWVLGAQAPKAVRSQKMDDVIFAGTASRPALGRAEVSITIDNSDGTLGVEFNEVTVTRVLFRTGDSEYAINGVPCRLLDVQELLSDAGVGRQQHVIVSQGQIDAVLNARPEERRAIIEEAAGVLKFRKRKEKAERRLDATEANLLRVQDLLREVRRQLRPLERQAQAAERHGSLITELTEVKTFVSGREIASWRAKLESLAVTRLESATAESELKSALAALDTQVMAIEAQLSARGASDVSDRLVRVEQLRERARGLAAVLVERRRSLERDKGQLLDAGVVANLEADAARFRSELDDVVVALAEIEPASEVADRRRGDLPGRTHEDDGRREFGSVRISSGQRRRGGARRAAFGALVARTLHRRSPAVPRAFRLAGRQARRQHRAGRPVPYRLRRGRCDRGTTRRRGRTGRGGTCRCGVDARGAPIAAQRRCRRGLALRSSGRGARTRPRRGEGQGRCRTPGRRRRCARHVARPDRDRCRLGTRRRGRTRRVADRRRRRRPVGGAPCARRVAQLRHEWCGDRARDTPGRTTATRCRRPGSALTLDRHVPASTHCSTDCSDRPCESTVSAPRSMLR